MKASELKNYLKVLKAIKVKNQFGEEEEIFFDDRVIHAEIKPLSGRELFAAKQVIADVSYKVRTRIEENIDRSMRLKDENGDEYEILYVLKNPATRELIIYAREIH